MKEYYEMQIAGLTRQLPVCRLSDDVCIAGFVIFGDVELTVACARELLKKIDVEYDVMITAESKGIPLAYEMARQNGTNKYLLARKVPKLYMKDCIEVKVNSITTAKQQSLYLDKKDMDSIKGKRVLIVDDVISTGESLYGLEQLVNAAGGNIVAKACILAEGDAAIRNDLIYLEPLPILDKDGNPLEK